ncbi:MAG: RnfABCDGE type electron transport complex subunit D [Oscillospiraceae bacterium]|nr:RnfABCDGE type electron transport complex subunit D [Oscillospiraceae bacterium]MCL2279560.1 RnfABCDGE type electron transport complex subunit D [Oscillospiraceae bacterium]
MSKLTVSVSPHIHDKTTTTLIMLDVIIALIPAFIASILIFGVRAAVVTMVCISACVFFEWVFEKITKRPNTISDLTAIITGILLAFNLPVTIPLWQAVLGSAVAIILVKQLFGGLGKNFANPAITARIVLFLAFSVTMTNWDSPYDSTNLWVYPIDGVAGATPLALMWRGETEYLPSMLQMFLGIRGGSLGETSNLALLMGGVYLIARKVITWHIPVIYIGVVVVLTALLGENAIYHMFAGGLFLGAIFMATDYVTSPQTKKGKLIFAVGAGLFTVLFRIYSSYPEGVSFAILIMNILTPYINKYTQSVPLGRKK